MYLVTSRLGDNLNCQVATTVMQVSNQPVKVIACLCKTTYTHELINQSRVFGVSVLSKQATMKFIGGFGYKCGRECNKFENVNYEIGETGCPLVTDNALVVLEAEVNSVADVGTHTIFIGVVKNSKAVADGEAMTYEYYHNVIKGKSPKSAPTYISNQ